MMDFLLRKWQNEDLEDLVFFANNQKIAQNLMNRFPHPYTLDDGKFFIDMANQHSPTQIFAIEINNRASGAIGIHPQDDIFLRNAELGYWLAEPFWGRGIITKAVKKMVEYGFEQFDIDRIFARPFGQNIASQKVLEKNGFSLEATFKNTIFKNGIYQDELIYAIRKNKD